MIIVTKYYGKTCAPCISVGRILEKVKKVVNFELVQIEVNQHPLQATQANVTQIPTITIQKDGIEVNRWSGVKSSREIAEILENYI